MNNQNSNNDRSRQFEWLLSKRLQPNSGADKFYESYYGDVTELNSCRLILDSVGRDTLQKIAEDAIDLLETSIAIYEVNGDYAFGMFSSGWCRLMDAASRKLCHTDDNRTALGCGCWLCHENCWNDSAKTAIESGYSTDIQCVGGINLYGEPIYAGEDVIGAINIGYGTPPTDSGRLKELAESFDIDPAQLKKQAGAYDERPQFIVDLAKKRLKTSANLIGEMVEKSMLQKALQKNKEFLETTGRMARIGGWEFDAETSEIRWTKETFRIHEVSMDYKPTLEKVIEFYHPQDQPEVLKAFQNALDEGRPYDMEVQFITAKGNHLWTRTKCEAEILEGKVIRLKGTFQDISERKQAERESLILKTAIDQAPVGIALADEDINIYFCNPEGLGMRGGSIDDLVEIPKDAFNNWQVYMLNGEPYQIDNLPLVRAIKTGATIREDFIVKHQDGTIHICDAFACPVIENNTIIGGMAIFLDITERKKVEEKIKKNEKNLHNILETIQAGVVVHDSKKSRVTKFNPAALKILGLTEDQFLGKSTAEPGWGFIHENGEPMQVDEYPVNIVKRTKQPLLDYVVGITKPSKNEPTWALVNATPQFDQDGNLSEIINSSMDITELKKTQSQLQEKTEQLMQAQKLESIGNLAGGIAHDFNNILSSIIGFTELAIDDVPKDSNLEDSLQEVYIAGKRAKDLVIQILTFARKSNEETKSVNIGKLAEESIKLLRSSIPVNIEIDQKINTDAVVVGNPSLLQQVILNISSNAADAMEDDGGVLKVTASDIIVDERFASDNDLMRSGDYVQIIISDTGTGIPPDIIKSIFEPYFTTKRQGKGTGMGLATAYGTVKKYGGAIHVRSRLGKGTVFSILLPATPQSEAAEPYELEELPGGKECLLFVDDEIPIVKMGKQLFERLGYRVSALTSSPDALELFRAKPNDFDLVVTDMTMPNLTGDKFAIELIKIRRDIPVILCTGYSTKISDETASQIGIKAFVYKPVVKADLAKTVRKVLDDAKG